MFEIRPLDAETKAVASKYVAKKANNFALFFLLFLIIEQLKYGLEY